MAFQLKENCIATHVWYELIKHRTVNLESCCHVILIFTIAQTLKNTASLL